ncbi:MAG: LuxR family transcriptional regulator [Chloroflexi bacterium]|nr:LuxR family transcriptional regulator [Chloroflexota bacterium]
MARDAYQQALALRRELGEHSQLAYTLANLATVARYQGDYPRALALEEKGLALARTAGDEWAAAHALKHLSRIHLFVGQHPQAKVECQASLAHFSKLGGTFGTAFCLEVLAAVEALDKHPTRAARLLGAADGLRQRFGLAFAPAERAEYLRIETTVRGSTGVDAFEAARAEGRAMPLATAVAFALAAGQADRLSPAASSPLSRRELEVAGLIARGLSNREIAEALVIAERTTEAHVTHILSKLGLRSRAQIAVWSTRQARAGVAEREADAAITPSTLKRPAPSRQITSTG